MQPYDQRLDTLLAAAAKTFAERGYHATSMRDLARASGFSLAGMYHYVESKQALLFQIQDRCFVLVLEGARDGRRRRPPTPSRGSAPSSGIT